MVAKFEETFLFIWAIWALVSKTAKGATVTKTFYLKRVAPQPLGFIYLWSFILVLRFYIHMPYMLWQISHKIDKQFLGGIKVF
jgi:membrane-bound acyltransferase YfiQ involved in biofilm formation